VDRLEQRPHRTGQVKVSHNHVTVSLTPGVGWIIEKGPKVRRS
jgi:hypothetical protein